MKEIEIINLNTTILVAETIMTDDFHDAYKNFLDASPNLYDSVLQEGKLGLDYNLNNINTSKITTTGQDDSISLKVEQEKAVAGKNVIETLQIFSISEDLEKKLLHNEIIPVMSLEVSCDQNDPDKMNRFEITSKIINGKISLLITSTYDIKSNNPKRIVEMGDLHAFEF